MYCAGKGNAASCAAAVADYTRHAASQTKEMVVDKAAPAKDVTVDSGKKAVGYTSEKAVQAKDATIDA